MIKELLTNNIYFIETVDSLEKAIRVFATLLLKEQKNEDRYVDAIIDNVNKNRNYIILLPEVAMPHVRNAYGSLKTRFSFLKLDDSQLEMLTELSDISN